MCRNVSHRFDIRNVLLPCGPGHSFQATRVLLIDTIGSFRLQFFCREVSIHTFPKRSAQNRFSFTLQLKARKTLVACSGNRTLFRFVFGIKDHSHIHTPLSLSKRMSGLDIAAGREAQIRISPDSLVVQQPLWLPGQMGNRDSAAVFAAVLSGYIPIYLTQVLDVEQYRSEPFAKIAHGSLRAKDGRQIVVTIDINNHAALHRTRFIRTYVDMVKCIPNLGTLLNAGSLSLGCTVVCRVEVHHSVCVCFFFVFNSNLSLSFFWQVVRVQTFGAFDLVPIFSHMALLSPVRSVEL